MDKNDFLIIIVSFCVMVIVPILDQIAEWPTWTIYVGAIILYPSYIFYYSIPFCVGAVILYYISRKREEKGDFFFWANYTFISLFLTWPFLVIVVYFASHASIISIMLTDFISLVIAFYPIGMIFAAKAGFNNGNGKDENRERRQKQILGLQLCVDVFIPTFLTLLSLVF
ncbi:MAG: hypothetical protein ACFFAN_11640 [Promethearchaeota archaeon]